MRVLNPRDEQVVLKKGVKLAKMESIEENCTVRVSAIAHREKTRGIILESLCDITENHTQITRIRFSM